MNLIFTLQPGATAEQAVQDVLEAVRKHFDTLRSDALQSALSRNTQRETRYYEGVASAYQNASLFLRDIKTEYAVESITHHPV